VIYEDALWRLEHVMRPLPMAGWLILKPLRHVESIAAVTPAEAASLGTLVMRTAKALERATGVKKVYVGLFAEATNFAHIHIHLIPRPARLAARLRGPLIFELLRSDRVRDRAPLAEAEKISDAVRRSLSGP
jgi:diadenosine tetraphosphate (Ap4A) HIT family hydrolase